MSITRLIRVAVRLAKQASFGEITTGEKTTFYCRHEDATYSRLVTKEKRTRAKRE